MVAAFDSHAHLQEPEFAEDLPQVLARAKEAGVEEMLAPAVDIETARAGIVLAESHEGLWASAGYHPHEASKLDAESLRETEALLAHDKVVAVGEIGLDYYRMHSAAAAQREVFGVMLALARRHRLPVVVHCRDAWEDMAERLGGWAVEAAREYGGRPLGVMHYFTGTAEEARRYIDLGFLISVHTSVTHPKSSALREVVAGLPLESLLIETDSPYGAPQAFRGKRNEPAFVMEAAKQVAELKGVDVDRVIEATSENARRLFGIGVASGVLGQAQDERGRRAQVLRQAQDERSKGTTR